MSRISHLDSAAVEAAIKDYLSASRPSLNACATRHGIPESSLRRIVKQRGIIRSSAPDEKRQLVAEHFAGNAMANQVTNDEARQKDVLDEAEQDIADMTDALNVARAVLRRLLAIVNTLVAPRDLKAVCEANKSAMETIRRVRGLDVPMDFSNMSDEELLRIVNAKVW